MVHTKGLRRDGQSDYDGNRSMSRFNLQYFIKKPNHSKVGVGN